MNLEEYIKLNKEIVDKQEILKKEGAGLFKAGLSEIFKQNPELQSFEMYVDNHEFADGDPTSFRISYEDPTLTLKNGDEYSGYPKNDKFESIQEQISKYFSIFDNSNFYEDLFSDSYCRIIFSVDAEGTLTYE